MLINKQLTDVIPNFSYFIIKKNPSIIILPTFVRYCVNIDFEKSAFHIISICFFDKLIGLFN